jgi:hypothetical protein
MSEGNVELVQALNNAFNHGDAAVAFRLLDPALATRVGQGRAELPARADPGGAGTSKRARHPRSSTPTPKKSSNRVGALEWPRASAPANQMDSRFNHRHAQIRAAELRRQAEIHRLAEHAGARGAGRTSRLTRWLRRRSSARVIHLDTATADIPSPELLHAKTILAYHPQAGRLRCRYPGQHRFRG